MTPLGLSGILGLAISMPIAMGATQALPVSIAGNPSLGAERVVASKDITS
ncbi:MAG: hypothetical protein WA397_17435 [Roseiarcus sp.]